MSLVGTGVLSKLQAMLPNQIGSNTRWSTATVNSLILAADRATRDRVEMSHGTQVISLVDDTISYDVAQNFISINKVEFALDGSNYDWKLQPRSMSDLDGVSHTWRTDRSTRPDFYCLLSAPGVQDNGDAAVPSQILLYPALRTAGSATVKLTGVTVPVAGAFVAAFAPDDVQTKCHVPYVLSMLYAVEDPVQAAVYYDRWMKGCESVRNRFQQQGYLDYPARA